MTANELIREARRDAGLTQQQLARRLGVTQATLAKLERNGSNPTVRTLERVLRATGRRLELRAKDVTMVVDETQLREHLGMTPAERLRTFEASHRNLEQLVRGTRHA